MRQLMMVALFGVLVNHGAYAFEHREKLAIKRSYQDFTFVGEADYRFSSDRFNYHHYDIGVRYPLKFLGDGWSAGLHYRGIYNLSDNGKWRAEKRPHAHIQKRFYTPEYEFIPKLKWTIRARQENRMRENGNHTSRHRARITIQKKDAIYSMKPFIGNEFFYDFDDKAYNKNWAIAGVSIHRFEHIKPSMYYKLSSDKNDDGWESTSSIVFKLEF